MFSQYKYLMHNSSFIILSGVLPANIAIITIILCYQLNVDRIYHIGFSITGVCIFLFYFTFQNGVLKILPFHNGSHFCINILKYTILLCGFGIFGQGIITLNDDINNYCVIIFFLSGLIHGFVSIYLYHRLKDKEEMKLLKCSIWFKSIIFMVSLTQIVASITSIMNYPITFNNNNNVYVVTKYIVIFIHLIFFSLYSLDYYLILNKRKQKYSTDNNENTLLMDEVEMFLNDKPNFEAVL